MFRFPARRAMFQGRVWDLESRGRCPSERDKFPIGSRKGLVEDGFPVIESPYYWLVILREET